MRRGGSVIFSGIHFSQWLDSSLDDYTDYCCGVNNKIFRYDDLTSYLVSLSPPPPPLLPPSIPTPDPANSLHPSPPRTLKQKVLEHLAERGPVVTLTDGNFTRYAEGKSRPYHLVLLFTAMLPTYNCGSCRYDCRQQLLLLL